MQNGTPAFLGLYSLYGCSAVPQLKEGIVCERMWKAVYLCHSTIFFLDLSYSLLSKESLSLLTQSCDELPIIKDHS